MNSGAGPVIRSDLSCSPGLGQAGQSGSGTGASALSSGLTGQLAPGSGLRRIGEAAGLKGAGASGNSGVVSGGGGGGGGGLERIRSASLSSQPGMAGGSSGPGGAVSGGGSGGGSSGPGGAGVGLKRTAQMAAGGASGGGGVSGGGGGSGVSQAHSGSAAGPGGGSGGGGGGGGGVHVGPSGHKRSRVVQDLSFTDVPRHAAYEDFDIFDKVRFLSEIFVLEH